VLSPLFEPSIVTIYLIDTELSARLSLYFKLSAEVRTTLDELKDSRLPRLGDEEVAKRVKRVAATSWNTLIAPQISLTS